MRSDEMTVIKNVTEVEYRIHKDMESAGALVKTATDEIGKWYEVETVDITIRPGHAMPNGFAFRPQGSIFMAVEPVACWINDAETGDEMHCDSLERMEKEDWMERDRRAFQKRRDEDLTGQDEESYGG
jgi:hypothetical protein